ncbi:MULTISPECIES: J domain-containing protein [Paenibacillus]|uniref:J domain-containing protein n=1 Tax=Paenibacillus albilobatus TaxID=2716884 RepID=A0A920C9W8_9BACL|nr:MULTISPECIES: J domain-containing protein [Paenibacillus]GIO31555.1 hypothetical protein J2TS6_26960 [Paenibacillus albilobatus]
MNIWSILGIEPTDDIAQIRKAYASMLKKHHPEDDPAGYQRLREAFDEALKLAKKGGFGQKQKSLLFFNEQEEQHERNDSDEDDNVYDDDDINIDTYDEADSDLYSESESNDLPPTSAPMFHLLYHHGETSQEKPVNERVDEFMDKLDSLYTDFPSRCNPELWLELLNSDILWKVEMQSLLNERILAYLNEHYFLPSEIWELLEGSFHWKSLASEDPDVFLKKYPRIYAYIYKVDFFTSEIVYSDLLTTVNMDHDSYFRCREAFVKAWFYRRLEEAEQALNEAMSIFAGERNLLWMQIEFYRQCGNLVNALDACERYINAVENNNETVLQHARILIQIGRLTEALDMLESIKIKNPDQIEILSLLGQCYMRLERIEAAREVYQHILKINPNDSDAVIQLAKIHRYVKDNIPYLKRKERRETKQKLIKEWSRPSLHVRLKIAGRLLLSNKWITLFFLIVLHITIAVSWNNHVEVSPWGYVKQMIHPVPLPEMTTEEELKNVPEGRNAVRLKLKNVVFTGIQIVEWGSEGGKKTYLLQRKPEKKENISGYYCVGSMGNSALIFLANYEQTLEIYEKKPVEIEITGYIQPSQGIFGEIDRWRKFTGHFDSYRLSDQIIDSSDGSSHNERLPSIPFMIYIFTALLLLFYISLIAGLNRIRRYLRFY